MSRYQGLMKIAVVIGTGNSVGHTYQPPKQLQPTWSENNPWKRTALAFIPGVSIAADAADLVGNIRRGNWGSAVGNVASGVLGLAGLGWVGRTAGLLGRAGMAGTKALQAGRAAAPAAAAITRGRNIPFGINMLNRPGITQSPLFRNMSRARSDQLMRWGNAMEPYAKARVVLPAMGVAMAGGYMDPKPADPYAPDDPQKQGEAGPAHAYGLGAADIIGLRVKRAGDSFMGGGTPPQLVSLADIYDAIEADRDLTFFEREQLVKAIRASTAGRSDATLVSSLMSGALGAILGQLVAKYFKSGVIGQALGAALGFAGGRKAYSAFTTKDPMPGYKRLG